MFHYLVCFYFPDFVKCVRVPLTIRKKKILWKDDLVQGDINYNRSCQGYTWRQMPHSFHNFTLKEHRAFLFHSNFTIIGFICANCTNCFIRITAFHLWKQMFVEFVEVRHIVGTRQKYISYTVFHTMRWTDFK